MVKELDFTGEWLTRDGSKASVKKAVKNKIRVAFDAIITTDKGGMHVFLDADAKCQGFSGWDLQKRLDGYTK